MTKKNTEVIVQPVQELQREENSVEAFITKALESNTPVETMEKLFALQEKVIASRAKAGFVQALSAFQAKCPVIEKKKKVMNKDGSTIRYKYAPMDSIIEQIQKPLAESSISYTWEVKNEPGFITAVAIATHILGHSERSEFKVPIDTEGYMTTPQKYASALTFAKRYSLCNVLGISTGDEDTDATDVNKEAAPKSVKSKIIFLLKTLNKGATTKEQIEKSVKELTQLDLVESNYEEIVGLLEIIVQENNENPKI